MHRHWVWRQIDTSATASDLKAKYESLEGHGIHGVFLGGGIDQREFQAVKEAGLELHSWMWTTNRSDEWIMENHPDWYMVSRSGKSCFDSPPYVDYYRWVSPVIPGVQEYLKEKVDELAQNECVDGVHLDYVRYPDVVLPRGLWEHYGLDQSTELPDYDFCYSEHTRAAFKAQSGRDPLEIQDPAQDQEWLQFRYDSVTNLVIQLAQTARARGKQITAAVFPTPSQARTICRQDWDKWPLDAFFPMLYQSFYDGRIEFIGDCMRENKETITAPIYGGLYLPSFKNASDFEGAVSEVLDNGGAGISIFGAVPDEMWRVLEGASTQK